jgi:hypothetical protein
MEITISLFSHLALKIGSEALQGDPYPTARLQKGLRLIQAGQELTEEAVGLGVPLLKRGLQTIFPGGVALAVAGEGQRQTVTATFNLNLEEKLARPGAGSVKNRALYALKNYLAALIRRIPPMRGWLTAVSNLLRWLSGWKTVFEAADFTASITVRYSIDCRSGVVDVEVDARSLPPGEITEVVIMNELGAHHFDRYQDSGGTCLRGDAIGCWDEVTAAEACFESTAQRLAFALRPVPGAKLYRGRELVGSRLAWSGFGYSFPPDLERLSYTVKIRELP